jgi:hypothetical protein
VASAPDGLPLVRVGVVVGNLVGQLVKIAELVRHELLAQLEALLDALDVREDRKGPASDAFKQSVGHVALMIEADAERVSDGDRGRRIQTVQVIPSNQPPPLRSPDLEAAAVALVEPLDQLLTVRPLGVVPPP